MGSSFWSDVCSAALSQTPQRKATTTNALCGVMIAFYALVFCASLHRVKQFLSLSPANRSKVWPHFRAFNAMLMCACVVGAAAWASNVQATQLHSEAMTLYNASVLNGTLRPTPPDTLARIKRLAAESASWGAAFFVFSSVEFAMVRLWCCCRRQLPLLFLLLSIFHRRTRCRTDDLRRKESCLVGLPCWALYLTGRLWSGGVFSPTPACAAT